MFLLKGFHRTKLKEYFFAFFNKGFIASEIEERTSALNRFSVVLFFFYKRNFWFAYFPFNQLFCKRRFFRDLFFLENTLGFWWLLDCKKDFGKAFCDIIFNAHANSIIFNSKKHLYTHDWLMGFSNINFILLHSIA